MSDKHRNHSFQKFLTILLLLCLRYSVCGVSFPLDSIAFQPNRFYPMVATGGTIITGSLTGLYTLWYEDYEQSGFHTFNDNGAWLQMDKIGHTLSAYYIGEVSHTTLQWCGVKEKKAIWYGGLTGLGYLTVIEVFDGFSEEWGFSWGDMAANAAGSGLYIGQELLWEEQRIRMKYNFIPSPYAKYRPSTLGVGFLAQSLKDYNGQAYWLSTNPNSWVELDRWPKWLNLAFGYSADGMTGGDRNVFPLWEPGQSIPEFTRTRQYYLSLDLNLHGIPAKRNWFRAFRSVFGFIKVPAPALGINSKGDWLFEIR